MKKILTIILCSALVMISGCDKYDFDQEQFRKEVNLLSNSNLVYDRQVAELQQGGDTLFVVASLSGSQATDEPVTVVLQHSDTLLRAYNKSNFDINKARFAKYLPVECYEFPNEHFRRLFQGYVSGVSEKSGKDFTRLHLFSRI